MPQACNMSHLHQTKEGKIGIPVTGSIDCYINNLPALRGNFNDTGIHVEDGSTWETCICSSTCFINNVGAVRLGDMTKYNDKKSDGMMITGSQDTEIGG